MYLKNFSFNVYLFLRESGAGSGREGDTESEPVSRLHAVNTDPDAGLNSRTVSEVMTWTEVQTLNWLSHPGAPNNFK